VADAGRRVGGRVARQPNFSTVRGAVGGLLLAIFAAPGAIVVLLGLELLEQRLFESGPAAKGGSDSSGLRYSDGSGSATAVTVGRSRSYDARQALGVLAPGSSSLTIIAPKPRPAYRKWRLTECVSVRGAYASSRMIECLGRPAAQCLSVHSGIGILGPDRWGV
jgi:hypothetical protein